MDYSQSVIDLNKFVKYWFSDESLWFPSHKKDTLHIDKLIKDKVGRYLDDDWTEFIHNSINQYYISGSGISNKQYVAYTLLLDQVNRHIYRDYKNNDDMREKRICNDNMARLLCICKLFPSGTFDIKYAVDYLIKEFKPYEIIFLLLPLRHGLHKDEFYIKLAFDIITEIIYYNNDSYLDTKPETEPETEPETNKTTHTNNKNKNSYNSYYKRFYRATLQQLATFNTTYDDINLLYPTLHTNLYDNINRYNGGDIEYNISIDEIINRKELLTIIDSKCHYNITQHDWRLSNMTVGMSEYQYQKWNTEFLESIKTHILNTTNNTLVLSVSGGVDSMLLLTSVLEVIKNLKYADIEVNIKKLNVVHINYMNRDTSYLEAKMVEQFVSFLNKEDIIHINYYQRNITEVLRENCPYRDIYEDITRNIRFKMYTIDSDINKTTVVLGHNKDDTLENIWNNIMKEQSYDNLYGMSINSKEKGIDIWRPFLNIDKLNIYQFANILGIPYLYDSTPSWSERGRKRDVLLPFIDRFDIRINKGVVSLADKFKEMYNTYRILAEENINAIRSMRSAFIITINDIILKYPLQLFKECMNQCIKHLQKETNIYLAISNKCIVSTYNSLLHIYTLPDEIRTMKYNMKTDQDTNKSLVLTYTKELQQLELTLD